MFINILCKPRCSLIIANWELFTFKHDHVNPKRKWTKEKHQIDPSQKHSHCSTLCLPRLVLTNRNSWYIFWIMNNKIIMWIKTLLCYPKRCIKVVMDESSQWMKLRSVSSSRSISQLGVTIFFFFFFFFFTKLWLYWWSVKDYEWNENANIWYEWMVIRSHYTWKKQHCGRKHIWRNVMV